MSTNRAIIGFFNAITYNSFQITLGTLVTLHNKYLRSKDVKNVFNRYSLLREMIKVIMCT